MNLHGEALINQLSCEDRSVSTYIDNLENAEKAYLFLTTTDESYKLNPQDARGVLPLDTKSELYVTGFEED